MGNSILYYIDTDLHDMTAEVLHRTLEQRIGSHIPVESWGQGNDVDEMAVRQYEWRLICDNANLEEAIKNKDLILVKKTPDMEIQMEYYNNTFEINTIVVNNSELIIAGERLNLFCEWLSEIPNEILTQLKDYIDAINKYIKPVTHSTRLFMCGDQGSADLENLWSVHIMDEGCTIDEAIQINRTNKEPETLYTWDNLDILMKDYVGWGIFDFSLTNTPSYLNEISTGNIQTG